MWGEKLRKEEGSGVLSHHSLSSAGLPSCSLPPSAGSQALSAEGRSGVLSFVSEAEGNLCRWSAKGTLLDQGSDVLLFLEL